MTAVEVQVCRCTHGASLHDDEDGCRRGECGCSEFRPATRGPYTPVVALPTRPRIEALLPCLTADCTREFESTKALMAHRETHQPPVVCPHCGHGFSRRAGLTRHLNESHSGDAVPPVGHDTGLPEGAKQGPSHDRSSAPAGHGQEQYGVLASPGTPTTQVDPAVGVGDAPDPAAGPLTGADADSTSPEPDQPHPVAAGPQAEAESGTVPGFESRPASAPNDDDAAGDLERARSIAVALEGENAELGRLLAVALEPAPYGYVDVDPDDLILLLVDVLIGRLDMPSVRDMLLAAFEIRDAITGHAWTVIQSGPLTARTPTPETDRTPA